MAKDLGSDVSLGLRDSVIRIENLVFDYARGIKGPIKGPIEKRPLFDKLSLSLESSNIYGLLGRNGAGKTTLLKLITGQLFRKGGNIRVLGNDPSRRFPDMLREIFFLPEELYIPALSGMEYLKLYSPFYPRFNLTLFTSMAKEFEIDLDQKLTSLSYGQKKKFLIAFGLATNCSLMIMDEPTNGLDIPSKSQFRKLVSGAVGENQVFIISTHQVRDLENVIDPIIILDNGRVLLNESLESISSRLSMKIVKDKPDGAGVVYVERVLGGYAVIEIGPSGEENIDIEVLFNAVISKPEVIKNLFGKRGEFGDEA